MRAPILAFLAVALVACLPVVTDAQVVPGPTPVSHCMHECAPHDADVNGAGIAAKGPAKVVLYGHFEDLLGVAMLNVQPPDPVKEPDLDAGVLMPTVDTQTVCTPPPGPQVCPDFHFANAAFVMQLSPGLVGYLADGWLVWNMPGLGAILDIPAPSFNLYWYLSAKAAPGQAPKVGVMPQVAVYARMETSNSKGKAGLVAESANVGQTPPGSQGRVNMVATPMGDDVYEFQVKMDVKMPHVPAGIGKDGGLTVFVVPYQVKTADQGGVQAAQAEWRLRTGARFPPRLVLPIRDPILPKGIRLAVNDGHLFVTASVLSALGAYDLNWSATRLTAEGGRPLLDSQIQALTKHVSNCHDCVFDATNDTWRIDAPLDQLDGMTFKATYQNRQDTFQVVQAATFHRAEYIGEGKAPGTTFLFAVMAVGVALLATRRRP